jgi:hypothetical protein
MVPKLGRLFLTVSVVATVMALDQSAGFAQGMQPPKQSLVQMGTSAGMTSAQGFGPAAVAYGAMGTPGGALTPSGAPGAQQLIGTGFTYRHDWGDLRGQLILNLSWGAITRNSRVFVAIGECDPGGGKFIGGARYTLYNVAPNDGVVSIWINVEWGSPIRVCVDYLVVNP